MSVWKRIRRWWLCRGLHGDCVMNQAMLDLGHMAPFGLCTTCEPRVLKLRAMFLPVATTSRAAR